jgi:hypothetical protein
MCCWESTACSRYTIVIGLIDASCFDTSALHFDAPSIAQPRDAHQRDGRFRLAPKNLLSAMERPSAR